MTSLSKQTVKLSEYLSGKRKQFDLPILTAGSEFQKQVWQALLAIPYGERRNLCTLSSSD